MSGRTVLLWGIDGDAPIADVRAALHGQDCRVVFLDQRQDADVDATLRVADTLEGALRLGDEWLNLSAVSAVYLRPFDPHDLPSCAGGDGSFDHALAVQDTLLSWAELTPALVLNRPSDMAANNSKPYQARWIESLGFRIPQTLLTTDPAAARAFLKRHGRVIYKSISGVRSIVSRVSDEHLGRFENIASCPTQFQEFIDGREYRVHVVGDTVIATEIVSDADDYRYAADAEMRAATLPDEVAIQCRVLARAMRLSLAGLDIRRSSAGEWYCFEVNPSPGYTFFEHHTGQPIAYHIARLLADGRLEARTYAPSGEAQHPDFRIVGRQEHPAIPHDGAVEAVVTEAPIPRLAVPQRQDGAAAIRILAEVRGVVREEAAGADALPGVGVGNRRPNDPVGIAEG